LREHRNRTLPRAGLRSLALQGEEESRREGRRGHEPGIAIDAIGPDGHLLIEAKGEAASKPQQANYFVGALGELVQRFAEPGPRYCLALPDNPQYRALAKKLPLHARTTLKLVVLFVSRHDGEYIVEEV
jgi:hypothetical protein